MKTNLLLHRMIFAALGFMLMLLVGCGGGDSSTPAGFASDQVAGKTFAYVSANVPAASALAFSTDGTWRSATYSGTWTIAADGKLVCVTTAGGNHTITYTLLDSTAGDIKVSAVEVNPADPSQPSNYTATLSTAFAVEMIAGQKFLYSSGSGATSSNGVIQFGHDGTWKTTTANATYIGTWNVVDGKLIAITTTGGDHTVTYTRLNANANPLSTSASEVAPSAPNSPVISTVTFSVMDGLVTAEAPKIFNFSVTFKNLPQSLPQTESTTPNYTVIPNRRQWGLFFIPSFTSPSGGNAQTDFDNGYSPDITSLSAVYGVQLYPNGIPDGTPAAGPIGTPSPLSTTNAYTPNPVSGITASFGFQYGLTDIGSTIDNYFYFDVTYPTATGYGHFSTPLLGFLIWSTPANSSWVYDYANNSMTQIN